MATQVLEKGATIPTPVVPPVAPVASQSSYLGPLAGIASPLTNVYTRFSNWKASFGLPNPGSVENLSKEVKQTHLTNYMFDGARADLTKGLSMEPAFQVTHSFALASQTSLPSYNFGAVFVSPTALLQGNIADDGHLNGRFHKQWAVSHVSKIQAQLASGPQAQNMMIFEHDITGSDFATNIRAMNPSPVDGSGVYIFNYLQSVSQNLALGAETILQRPAPGLTDTMTSYLLKYTGAQKDWIATAQVQPVGILQATYWQKLSEKVEVAAELQLIAAPQKREAVTTLGAKYDFRQATFRAQLDSTGKVSALLEQKFAPTFSFMFAGEIDHWKNTAKVGVGVMIESTSLTPEEMGYSPQGYPPSPPPHS